MTTELVQERKDGLLQERLTQVELEAIIEETRKEIARLTSRQKTWPLPNTPRQRKNYMRNHSCVCGSGKKFKKCCWSQYQ